MRLFGKINWPWTRSCKLIDEDNTFLRAEIRRVKEELMCKRVANFVMVDDYHKGMKLTYDLPKPILLEDLEKRIEELENKGQKGGV